MRMLICVGMTIALAMPVQAVGPDEKAVKEMRDKAIAYLSKHQVEDGSFSSRLAGPGVTALVVAALIRNGVSEADPVVAKALNFIEKNIQQNGGIYKDRMATYVTSVGLMALVEVNKEGKYDTAIKNALAFLRKMQYGDDTTKQDDVKYGGAGYDEKSRPDMSNTQFLIDAMVAAGIDKDDPALKNALIFVSRCQNLPGESNDQAFAKKTSDEDKGGFVYAPFVDEKDPRTTPQGGLRSMGAMTYAGLKTFLYAGVAKNDERVVAALKFIRKNYTLEENPGMGTAGLYYYYHTFAKAMTALGEDEFATADGKKHDWRKDLFEALKKRQQEDGSFVNKGERTFGESDANLATAFALLSLSYVKK